LEVSIGQLAYSAANVEVIVWDFDATASDWGVSFPSDLYLVRDADNVVAGPSITSAVDPSKVFAPNSLSVTGRGALNEVSDVLLNLEKFTVLKNIRLSVTFTLPGSDGAPAEIVRAIAVAATVCRIDEHEQGNGKPRRRCTDLAL
jgi:hypothetical protein